MTTKLIRFTEKARAEPQLRFNALMDLLFDPEGLHASFERQNGRRPKWEKKCERPSYDDGTSGVTRRGKSGRIQAVKGKGESVPKTARKPFGDKLTFILL